MPAKKKTEDDLAASLALELKYLRPARFNDEITVRTTLHRTDTPTLEFHATIVASDGLPCARGKTIHALTDLAGVTQYRLPEPLVERVERMLAWAEGI